MKQDEEARPILNDGHNVLLTGAAGSGKTFLLELFTAQARQQGKKVSVTATTDLAATSINGTTIHNWSGIGIRNSAELNGNQSVNNIANGMYPRYKHTIQNTDILVIDEISMLHGFQLDAINKIVCKIRNNNEPFGGLQVVLCRDFYQLPPIPENNEQVSFVTESSAYKNGIFRVCYLEEYHRHNEEDKLTKILNAIRANRCTQKHLKLLGQRRNAPLQAATVTRLCCTNEKADGINREELEGLTTAVRSFHQEIEGNGQPMEDLKEICKNKVSSHLHLKIGAVVIFNKNDPQGQYFNGSLGEVVAFNDAGWPDVQLNARIQNGKKVSGKLLKGVEQTDFYIEDENGNRLAMISQIPLKLAWAITIHKSQGMTLDAAQVDLSDNFVAGLGYVGLSRVRSIEDLSIVGTLNNQAVSVNATALNLESFLQDESKKTLRILSGSKNTWKCMDIVRAKEIVEMLAYGIDPTTDEIIPPENHFNNPEVIRALFTILRVVGTPNEAANNSSEEKPKDNSENGRPRNAGLSWSEAHRNEVAMLFKQEDSI